MHTSLTLANRTTRVQWRKIRINTICHILVVHHWRKQLQHIFSVKNPGAPSLPAPTTPSHCGAARSLGPGAGSEVFVVRTVARETSRPEALNAKELRTLQITWVCKVGSGNRSEELGNALAKALGSEGFLRFYVVAVPMSILGLGRRWPRWSRKTSKFSTSQAMRLVVMGRRRDAIWGSHKVAY